MPLVISETDNIKVYLTSDWHLNHKGPRSGVPLWQSRGYSSPEDMTQQIIATVNEIVRPTDVILFMGDLCLDTPRNTFDDLIGEIKCQNLWMLWGNHNNPHEKGVYSEVVKIGLGHNDVRYYPVKYRNLRYMGDYAEVVVNGQFMVLFHYPIWEWNEKRNGAWMIHGHSHYNFVPGRADHKEAKILDVSWDGFKKPLSFEDVKAIMDTKGIPVNDHHAPDSERNAHL